MTGIEALQALKDGEKVRDLTWLKGFYIYFDKESGLVKDENNTSFDFNIGALLNDTREWEIYEETTTLHELLGCTIRLNGRNYYVVPYILQRIYRNEIVRKVVLMPVDQMSGPLSWIYLSLTHKIPTKDILKTPTDNGITILG